ncbi:MAG: heme exporter protein A [Gammaproteobacteria bacterium]
MQCERGEKTLFGDLNFSAQASDIVQLQGSNGSGKTSLLRILCGLARPLGGTICWNGADIQTDLRAYQAVITYVGHRRGVCADLSPLENLKFACDLDDGPTLQSCREALQIVGLDDVADNPTRFLSAGQVQRTALARLLVRDTPIWCLDEPFTALDRAGREVVERLVEVRAQSGGICIVATHQPMSLDKPQLKILDLDAL